ncbi:hypothetical protein HPP92_002212 [Vanilla planifolia]|uniref:Uncharacterized protein n=1 Tax=Vanilla planifolia TaxID=51239 RepID=A0A835RZT2_VANPL|nr:hypothetical protein HPP92_002212 [Vanilla planifolia]
MGEAFPRRNPSVVQDEITEVGELRHGIVRRKLGNFGRPEDPVTAVDDDEVAVSSDGDRPCGVGDWGVAVGDPDDVRGREFALPYSGVTVRGFPGLKKPSWKVALGEESV